MTLILACGGECGATGTKMAKIGNATLSTTTGVRTGQRAFRSTPAGTSSYHQHTLVTAAPTQVIQGWVTLPALAGTAGDWQIFLNTVSGGQQAKIVVTSAGVCKFGFTGGIVTHPTTIVAGTMYRFDFRVLNNDGTGTKKMDLQIDGVAGTQATLVEAGSNVTALRFGAPAVTDASMDVVWDDLVVGNGTGDYPWSPDQQVSAVYVNADGTHSFTAGDFGDNVGVILSSTTVAYQEISGSPMPEAGSALPADYLEQIVTRTTSYLEFAFDMSAITGEIWGIVPSVAVQAETAASAGHVVRINDNGTEETSTTRPGTVAVTTIVVSWKEALAVRPSTGTAWTVASLSTLRGRWGYSGDATPDVRLAGFVLEISHTPDVAAGAFPYTGGGYYPN